MVREARALVRAGAIGAVRKAVVECHQSWLAGALESSTNEQSTWRNDPLHSGLAGAMGDIGSDAESPVSAVTGLEVESVCDNLSSFGAGRRLDDEQKRRARSTSRARPSIVLRTLRPLPTRTLCPFQANPQAQGAKAENIVRLPIETTMISSKAFRFSVATISLLLDATLVACGGGGGSAAAPTPPAAIAPTVSIALSATKTSVNTPVTLTWSSTDATSCSGPWSGTQGTSGTTAITPTSGGQFKYTVSCTGAGGTATDNASLIVPIPVQPTSYLNFKYVDLPAQTMPTAVGFQANEAITAGHAYGDFFQDGTLAMVAFSNVFDGTNGDGSTVAGRAYFFHTDGKGGWVDQTTQLLTDRTGCISPRKVIVADFNGDGIPDIFVACHGIDGTIPAGYPQGEHPRYLLSQADGTYANVELPIICYCHGAAAADFSGDGFADVVLASPPVLDRMVYLKNSHDGTFVDTPALIPQSTNGKQIWSLDFVDLNGDGKYDLAVYGSENYNGYNADPALTNTATPGTAPTDWQPTIFLNDGTNTFSDASSQVKLPFSADGDVLDIIVSNSKIAVLRSNNNVMNEMMVQEWSYSAGSAAVMNANYVPAQDTVWFRLFQGNVIDDFLINPYSFAF